MRRDANGKLWTTTVLITAGIMAVGGVVGGVIGAISSAVTQKALAGTINWKSVAIAGVSGFVSGAIAASLLGIRGQVIAGTLIGSTSYVVDCVVNKKPIAVDEFIVSTIGGAASGFISGPGANENLILTRTIQASQKTITRMSTRECITYAAKQTASAKEWRNNILTYSAMKGSVLFAAGTGVSNGFSVAWTKVKDWFSNLFK